LGIGGDGERAKRAKGAYAKRHFGNVRLKDLTPVQIESALNVLRCNGGKKTAKAPEGRPLSAKTVREIAALVNATFNAAIRWASSTTQPDETRHTATIAEK
jgi:hypothetical protein